MYHFPDKVPTLTGGSAVLMSVQGLVGVSYIPLAPLSTMAVSVLGNAKFFSVKVAGVGTTVIIRRSASVC